MDKTIFYVNKEDYILEDCKDFNKVKEIWLDFFHPPNSKYLKEIPEEIIKNVKFAHLQIITEDNYVSSLKELIMEPVYDKIKKVIITFSWFSDIPTLYKIEKLLYEVLSQKKNVYTLGIPLCYLVGFFDRSIEYQLIKKYGYEEAIKRLPWKYAKSEQCNACFKKHLCFGVPEFYANRYYDKRKIAAWEGIIDLYPLFE